MTMISVKIETEDANRATVAGYRATGGGKQSVGRTRGEALDALLDDWTTPVPEVEVETAPFESEADSVELISEGGFWVIAGGDDLTAALAGRDFVAEMREERIRSVYPEAWKGK